jgi:hypothetical protein
MSMDYLQRFPNYFKDLKTKWMELFDKIVSNRNRNPLKISKSVLSGMNAPEIMLINALHWINEDKRNNTKRLDKTTSIIKEETAR